MNLHLDCCGCAASNLADIFTTGPRFRRNLFHILAITALRDSQRLLRLKEPRGEEAGLDTTLERQSSITKQPVVSQRWLIESDARAKKILQLLKELKAGQHLERLLINIGGHLFFFKTKDIHYVKAEGNYVRLHSGSKSFLLRRAMGQLEKRLDPSRFLRIHRSTIVNIDCVRELQPRSHGELNVILQDGTELTWSRGYKGKLKRF